MRLIIAGIAFLLLSPGVVAQEWRSIFGTVRDAETKTPIDGSMIILEKSSFSIWVNSGNDGSYQIHIPDSDTATLKFSYLGYNDLEFCIKGKETIDAELVKHPDTVRVVITTRAKHKKKVR